MLRLRELFRWGRPDADGEHSEFWTGDDPGRFETDIWTHIEPHVLPAPD